MNKSVEKICFQIRAIIIVKYFELYEMLEKEVKSVFSKEINNVDKDFKNKLYFLYGGKNSINIDTSRSTIFMENKIFKLDEDFATFTFNQIVKICKLDKKIEKFNFNIDSLQIKQEVFDFYSSCEKLISMRNKLAHEISMDSFEDKDYVEILSEEKIKENIICEISDYDITLMGITEKQIYSNLLYLNVLLKKIANKDTALNFI